MVKRTTVYTADDGSTHASLPEAALHDEAVALAPVLEKCVAMKTVSGEGETETETIDFTTTAKNLLKQRTVRAKKTRKPKAVGGKDTKPAAKTGGKKAA